MKYLDREAFDVSLCLRGWVLDVGRGSGISLSSMGLDFILKWFDFSGVVGFYSYAGLVD